MPTDHMVIGVCIPSRGTGHMPLVAGVQREIEVYDHVRPYFWSFYKTLPDAHNDVTAQALANERVTHLWFLEDDHLLPVGILRWLVKKLDEAPVVTGQYLLRNAGIVQAYHPRTGEVVMVPTGCLLVERSVFQHIPHPPFQRGTQYILDGGEWVDTGKKSWSAGDVFFSAMLRKAGVKMAAVEEPEVGHLDLVTPGGRSLSGVDEVRLHGGSGELQWAPELPRRRGKRDTRVVKLASPTGKLVIDMEYGEAGKYVKRGWSIVREVEDGGAGGRVPQVAGR